MKNTILTGAFFLFSNGIFAQTLTSDNSFVNVSSSSVLFSKNTNDIKPADCYGEWTSTDGDHLTLYSNNKAVWKDEGHVYYMNWKIENSNQGDNTNIVLLGNERCKHTALSLHPTDNGMEIVEDQTNLHLHFSKEVTATLQ